MHYISGLLLASGLMNAVEGMLFVVFNDEREFDCFVLNVDAVVLSVEVFNAGMTLFLITSENAAYWTGIHSNSFIDIAGFKN